MQVSNSWSQLTLLFADRRVYAYEVGKRSGAWEMESDFPKVMDKSISITPECAFTWRDGNQVLVQVGFRFSILVNNSQGNTFVTYNENYNVATFTANVRDYFANLPSDISSIVNADIEGRSRDELIVFTSDSKFVSFVGIRDIRAATIATTRRRAHFCQIIRGRLDRCSDASEA